MDSDPAKPQARAASQHEPHRPNPDFPHWGRDELDYGHAIFAIAAHLRSLMLESWTPLIVRWLSFYDGIERWVDPGQEPCLCVRDLLASYVARYRDLRPHAHTGCASHDPAALKTAIVEDLLQMGFLRYRAHWGRGLVPDANSLVWRPLLQSWLSFVEIDRPGDELMITPTEDRFQPPLAVHRAFLLQE